MRLSPSPVKALALARGLQVLQPTTLRDAEVVQRLAALAPDAVVVAAYGLLLPPPVLALGRLGAINIHASLLPRWRGAAPIQRALLAGDAETGVSIMQMEAGLDTGPVFAQRRTPIGAQDDTGTLHDRLAVLGADLLLEVLDALAQGGARSAPQDAAGATYARKIDKEETWLRWERPAAELERAIRAFRPSPGASARLDDVVVKLWSARIVAASGEPGTVLAGDQALVVACGEGALAIDELQPAGGRRMSAAQFVRGRPLAAGARFR